MMERSAIAIKNRDKLPLFKFGTNNNHNFEFDGKKYFSRVRNFV